MNGSSSPLFSLLPLFLLSLLPLQAYSCGVTTHNLVAHRAFTAFQTAGRFPQYEELIAKHQHAFQNGAAFPDFGYDCPLRVRGRKKKEEGRIKKKII